MSILLATIGTQELIILLLLSLFFLIGVPVFFYNRGRNKGKLEGRLEEMEKARNNKD